MNESMWNLGNKYKADPLCRQIHMRQKKTEVPPLI